jgi:Tol biopolymer transport system component
MELDSPANENSLALSSDELTVILASDGGPSPQGSYDLYVATRASIDSPFGALSPITALNSSIGNLGPSITGDGLTLFYTDVDFTNPSTLGNGDIQTATRSNAAQSFTAGGPVAIINNVTAYDASAFILPDGLTLYFASTRGGGATFDQSYDLYRATRSSVGGAFTEPLPVGELNTVGFGEATPVLTPDELTIYFGSNEGPTGLVESSIWMATRAAKTHAFGPRVFLAELNTSVSEWPAAVSADGCRLYFVSNRPGGTTDVWAAARPL